VTNKVTVSVWKAMPMADSLTVRGELLIPAVLFQARTPQAVVTMLQDAGVLPRFLTFSAWRPQVVRAGYLLLYEVTLVRETTHA
jgi:hypothetical protein